MRCNELHRRCTVILYTSQNLKRPELRFSTVVGYGASEVRFERPILS